MQSITDELWQEKKTMVEAEIVGKKGEQAIEETVAFEIEQNALRGLILMLDRLGDKTILFNVTERAMRLFAEDDGRRALAMGYINAESFKRYGISNEHSFAIETSHLKSMLALSDKKSLVHFAKRNKNIIMSTDDGFTQEFDINILGKSVRVPGIKYEEGDLISLMELYEVVKFADEIGSEEVKIMKDGLSIAVQFTQGNVIKEKRLQTEPNKIEKPIESGVFGIYPTKELKNVLKGMKDLCGDSKLMIRMKHESTNAGKTKGAAPLKMSFRAELGKNGKDERTIRGYALIAPRIYE